MAKTSYVYEVRFADKPVIQALIGFDNEIGFNGHKTLSAFLWAKHPDATGLSYKVLPPGVSVSFPLKFPSSS